MKLFEKSFRKGSLFLVLLYAAVALFFVVDAALGPEHRYVSLLLATAGLSGTWRQEDQTRPRVWAASSVAPAEGIY